MEELEYWKIWNGRNRIGNNKKTLVTQLSLRLSSSHNLPSPRPLKPRPAQRPFGCKPSFSKAAKAKASQKGVWPQAFLSKAHAAALCHQAQLVGSSAAKLFKVELIVKAWPVEGGVECAVGLLVDVDVDPLIYMRVALLHVVALLAGGVLDEEEVVVGIACDRPVAIFADLERPGLPPDFVIVSPKKYKSSIFSRQ